MFASVVLVCALSANLHVAGAAQPAAKPHPAAEPAQQQIGSADLEKQVGKHIIVHTKLDTVRSGTLTKCTQTSIDVKLDSGADLNVPIDTIRSVTIPVVPADPLFPTAGEPSAKKK